MVNVTEEPWIRVCCLNKKTSAVFITEHLEFPRYLVWQQKPGMA